MSIGRRNRRSWRRRRGGGMLPFAHHRRRRISGGKLAGAALAAAAAVPAAQKATSALGQGKRLAHQATDIIDTAGTFKDALASHSSTIGKVGGVISAAKQVGGGDGQNGSRPKLSHLIEEHIDIAVPRSTAYNQWTQFEKFPALMKGVDNVRQERRDDRLTWTAKIGPSRRQWSGRIVEQVPDERIAWKSEGGAKHQGVVTFHRLGSDLTRVLVQMEYQPTGAFETVANTVRVQRRRVRRDLRLFKHFLELRGEETGSWRGEIGGKEPLEPQYAGQGDGGGRSNGGAGKSQGIAGKSQRGARKSQTGAGTSRPPTRRSQGSARKSQGTAAKTTQGGARKAQGSAKKANASTPKSQGQAAKARARSSSASRPAAAARSRPSRQSTGRVAKSSTAGARKAAARKGA